MNHEEFAFVNHQLAGMLRDGIPLEGSLRQLCSQMQRGQLRSELQLLERDLAKGVPLATALTARKLPELYVQTLQIGARTNDLPAVLTPICRDRKSTRLNSSHRTISYAVFCLKK